jgi:hypothetical protein
MITLLYIALQGRSAAANVQVSSTAALYVASTLDFALEYPYLILEYRHLNAHITW